MRRVLSIDGGGIRGVYPAAVLAELDELCAGDIREYFDLIVGTSTGGILAIGLGLGKTPAELLNLYINKGPSIFGQEGGRVSNVVKGFLRTARQLFRGPKYRNAVLKQALVEELGEAKLGDSKNRLVITSFDYESADVRMDKTAHHENLYKDYKKSAVSVAMATSAAPTFFKPFVDDDSVGLIDGGVWANNPVAVAAREAIHYLGWGEEGVKILSIGTTKTPLKPAAGSGAIRMFYKQWIIDMFMAAQDSEAQKSARIITQGAGNDRTIWRVNDTVARGTFSLDGTERIKDLEGLGRSAARRESASIVKHFFQNPAEPFVPVRKEVT